jgi:hypothetical protein
VSARVVLLAALARIEANASDQASDIAILREIIGQGSGPRRPRRLRRNPEHFRPNGRLSGQGVSAIHQMFEEGLTCADVARSMRMTPPGVHYRYHQWRLAGLRKSPTVHSNKTAEPEHLAT